jgi:hypothetical protein
MLRRILLASAVIVSVQAIPVGASAEKCGGILSWLCFNSEPSSKSALEGSPQEQMTALRQYATGKPKKAANPARSRELRETGGGDASIDVASACLSLQQVRGGYPRYRVIGGRHCWYASTKGRPRKQAEIQKKQAEINVNPYDDPIWKQSDATEPELVTTQLQDCEEQALKLDAEEKRTFMKQCMSSGAR